MEQRRKLRWNRFKSGCGSVWLERCVRDAEAGGSNPLTPTIFFAQMGGIGNNHPQKQATALQIS